jgi:hypothetical protein
MTSWAKRRTLGNEPRTASPVSAGLTYELGVVSGVRAAQEGVGHGANAFAWRRSTGASSG